MFFKIIPGKIKSKCIGHYDLFISDHGSWFGEGGGGGKPDICPGIFGKIKKCIILSQ
jgi:hypothetical protein